MTNVVKLPNCAHGIEGEPNQVLIDVLENLLARAKDGQVQSFIGCGFTADGCRISTWVDHHSDVYQMLGSLAWLQHEYVNRHTEASA